MHGFNQEPCFEDVAGSAGIFVFIVDQLHAPAASLPGPSAGVDTVTYLSSITFIYRLTAARRRRSPFVCPPPAGHSSWEILVGNIKRNDRCGGPIRSIPGAGALVQQQTTTPVGFTAATRRQPTALYLITCLEQNLPFV